jgi:hypothetical protein
MPIGLSPSAALRSVFKSAAISFTFRTLSTLLWPSNTAGYGGLSLEQPAAYFGWAINASAASVQSKAPRGIKHYISRTTDEIVVLKTFAVVGL